MFLEIIEKISDEIIKNEEYLTELDREIGDGDHGVNLARGFSEIKNQLVNFKNFLSDYSQLEEAKITSVHLWEQYFVYAVALGVSEKVVKAYKKALDMGVINDVQGVNSLAYSPIFNPMFSRSFSNLNGMVSRTNSGASSAIASSRRSSSSGGGGGFSSRSSGGGGSRGGGGGF